MITSFLLLDGEQKFLLLSAADDTSDGDLGGGDKKRKAALLIAEAKEALAKSGTKIEELKPGLQTIFVAPPQPKKMKIRRITKLIRRWRTEVEDVRRKHDEEFFQILLAILED